MSDTNICVTMTNLSKSKLTFFIAGIMQGSHITPEMHNQDYRTVIKGELQACLSHAEIYDPWANHKESLEYNDSEGRDVFLNHNRMCGEVDVLIAYVPTASMGTAIEMWEAYRNGKIVISISPLLENWAVKFLSNVVYKDLAEFTDAARKGELAKKIINGDHYKVHILDANNDDLQDWLTVHNELPFRSNQIYSWISDKRTESFDEMLNLPKQLRSDLQNEYEIWSSTIERYRKDDDGTEKLLLRLKDGNLIESVLLREESRRTICISCQVGCSMGCVFCATGLDGVERNLTKGEIIEQMLRLQHLLDKDERLSHIVVMGMGEPLANLENLLSALNFATSDSGLGISARRITISTVGLPKSLMKLADLGLSYNLAISLHAPDDKLRNMIVPANRKIGIEKLLNAADYYFSVTGRRVTYEYVMLAGINDRPEHAKQLADLLKKRNSMLNVIPYNRVNGLQYETPDSKAIYRFRQILESGGINVQFRKRKGGKIDASCGQLRRLSLSLNHPV